MAHLYLIPAWFFSFSILMEILFGIITLAIAIIAYRTYKISQEKSMRNFSIGFLLISLSYLIWAATSTFVVSKIQDNILEIFTDNVTIASALGVYAHMFLLTIGLVTIVYSMLSIKKPEVYYLLLGLSFLVIASSFNRLITFRIVAVFLLSYLVYHFFVQWQEHKSTNLLCSFIAFALLLLSNLDFAFSASYYQAFVIGHIIELVAYGILLKNLVATTIIRKKH
jgi:hypothetical protein